MAKGKPAYVTIQLSSSLIVKYGFNCKLDDAQWDDLGIKLRTIQDACIFGTTTPKPPRATRFKAGHYEGSFVSHDKIMTAAAAGWAISYPGSGATIGRTTRSVTVYIQIEASGNIPEINYAWNMPITLYTAIGSDREAIGIKDADAATANDKERMVFNPNSPKPVVAKKRIETADGITFLKTFGQLGAAADGWTLGTKIRARV